MKVAVCLVVFAFFQSCCSQDVTVSLPSSPIDNNLPTTSSPPATSDTTDPLNIPTVFSLASNPPDGSSSSPLPTDQSDSPLSDPTPINLPNDTNSSPSPSDLPIIPPSDPTTDPSTPEQTKRGRISLFQIVDAVIRHGFKAQCLENFSAPDVAKEFRDTLENCINENRKSSRPLEELMEEENERHRVAVDSIKKNTDGILLLIRISVEMGNHAQRKAQILVGHVVSEIRRRLVSNTVECTLPIFGKLISNVDNDVEEVKQCLIASP